jgi:hypothetical protein
VKILRVLSRGRDATVRGAWQRLGPDKHGLSGTILQPTSTPSLHATPVPRRGFSCAAGDPTGHRPISHTKRVFGPSCLPAIRPARLPPRRPPDEAPRRLRGRERCRPARARSRDAVDRRRARGDGSRRVDEPNEPLRDRRDDLPGNLHSAHGWRDVLEPVVARYRGQALRRLLRGDAACVLPDVYEYLEAEAFQSATASVPIKCSRRRSPTSGSDPSGAHRITGGASTRASVITPRAGTGRAAWWRRSSGTPASSTRASGSSRPTSVARPRRRWSPSTPGAGRRSSGSRQAKHAVKWTRRSCTAFRADAVRLQLPCAGLQPRHLPAHPGITDGGGGVVPDPPPGEGGEDRRAGRRARALPRVPDGRGGGAARAIPAPPPSDRRAPPTCRGAMLTRTGLLPRRLQGRRAAAAGPTTAIRRQEPPWRAAFRSLRHHSGCKEPEITCQIIVRRAMDRPEGAFAPSIWAMSARLSSRPRRGSYGVQQRCE